MLRIAVILKAALNITAIATSALALSQRTAIPIATSEQRFVTKLARALLFIRSIFDGVFGLLCCKRPISLNNKTIERQKNE